MQGCRVDPWLGNWDPICHVVQQKKKKRTHMIRWCPPGIIFMPEINLLGTLVTSTASWAPKNWCFWTVVLEKTLESPLDWKEIQPVHPKGNHSWIFIGRIDSVVQTPILWPPDAKNWLIGKDPGRREEKGMAEDEMVGWRHWAWTWVRISFGSWWWTGKSGMLQSMGSQRVRHDWASGLINQLTL